MTEPLKCDSDYEDHLGEGRIRIYEGHPRYCPLKERHEEHTFRYEYLSASGGPIKGNYWCDGHPTAFAAREKPE